MRTLFCNADRADDGTIDVKLNNDDTVDFYPSFGVKLKDGAWSPTTNPIADIPRQ